MIKIAKIKKLLLNYLKKIKKILVRNNEKIIKLLYKKLSKTFKKLKKILARYKNKSIKSLKKKISNRWRYLYIGRRSLLYLNLNLLRAVESRRKNIIDLDNGNIKKSRISIKLLWLLLVFTSFLDWFVDIIRFQIVFKILRNFGKLTDLFKKNKISKIGSSNENTNQRSNNIIFNKYNKIFVIKINHSNAGFFTYLLFVLNQLDYCEKRNYYPVVNFDQRTKNDPFYDPTYGENMWDYYFEPLMDYTYSDIMNMMNMGTCQLCQHDLIELSEVDLWYMHQYDLNSIFAYPYGIYKYKMSYDRKWYERQRFKANYFIKKYIRIKSGILEEINEFYNVHMANHNVVGIHMRGTDKGTANAAPNTMRIIEPDCYVEEINKYLYNYPDSRIFVATDQQQYLDYIKSIYGDSVISYQSIRSTSKKAPFQIQDGNNYRKGKDVLIDALLLSRTQFLIKCASTVGEAALWFNPDLSDIDLNYLY